MRLIFTLCVLSLAFAGCAAASPKETQDEKGTARKLYVIKCAKCHKFYDPAKYSDEEWKVWMRKMSKKSKLTAEQERSLSEYIERTYRSGAKER